MSPMTLSTVSDPPFPTAAVDEAICETGEPDIGIADGDVIGGIDVENTGEANIEV